MNIISSKELKVGLTNILFDFDCNYILIFSSTVFKVAVKLYSGKSANSHYVTKIELEIELLSILLKHGYDENYN